MKLEIFPIKTRPCDRTVLLIDRETGNMITAVHSDEFDESYDAFGNSLPPEYTFTHWAEIPEMDFD